MKTVRLWGIFFLFVLLLMGFPLQGYSAEVKALVIGPIQKIEKDYIVVRGQRYKKSDDFAVSYEMDRAGSQPTLKVGQIVEFLPDDNMMIQSITIMGIEQQ